MTAVLVSCPLSTRTVDLLAAQLRELPPATHLLATSHCISEAHRLLSLTQCSPTEDNTWTEDASEALKAVLQREEVVVVVVGQEEFSAVLQSGQDTAMKVFAIDNQSVLAVVTAAEAWERLCWQGRVDTVHKAVLKAVQNQVNAGLKEIMIVFERLQARQLQLLSDLFESRLDIIELSTNACLANFEILMRHISAQSSYVFQAIPLLTQKFLSLDFTSSAIKTPPAPPIRLPRPAPQKVASESLPQDWQARICKLEQSLGEQLSQEALAVLMNLPGADFRSDADLISALLASA